MKRVLIVAVLVLALMLALVACGQKAAVEEASVPAQEEGSLSSWVEGMTCKLSRFIGDGESADLCTWYDVETGISYSLSTVAADLDGFDIIAVAGAMAPTAEPME